MTAINQESASRRFHQGLHYLLEISDGARERVDPESILAVVTVMAYLGAYVFPDENLHGLKLKPVATLQPCEPVADIGGIVEKAAELAQVFRRPWSEVPSGTI